MRIGIYLGYLRNEDIGGGYVFYKNVLDAFISYSNLKYEIYVFYYSQSSNINFSEINKFKFVNLVEKNSFSNRFIKCKRKIKKKIVHFFRIFDLHFISNENLNYQPSLNEMVKKFNIDLVYFLTPNYETISIPYLFTVWDVEHKNYPFLPEYFLNDEFDNRENFYKKILPKAAKIIIGNNVGKKQLIDFYQIPDKLIKTIPMPLPNDVYLAREKSDILTILNLKEKEYLYYPAQFWAHKNHIILLKKFKEISKIKNNIKIVFSGSDQGNLKYIKSKIKQLNLENDIIYAGFISRKDVICLYINAFALVYPSLLGPDNIPPIEAMALKCPVICAENEGMRLQLENNALFFNPITGEGLLESIAKLDNNIFRDNLTSSAYKFVSNKYSVNDYVKNIVEIFDEYYCYWELWKMNKT